MATMQKRPRRLPKLSKKEEEEKERDAKRGVKGAKGDGAAGPGAGRGAPPPGKKQDLPPIRRGGRRDMDSKSMVEMGQSTPPPDMRTSLTATHNAKSCFFYIDDDYLFPPIKMVIHPKKHRKLDTVSRDLSVRMKSLPFGVRSIHTPRGQHRIHNLEDFTQDGHYICSSNRKYVRGLDVARVQSKHVWHHLRPDSGRKGLTRLLQDYEHNSAKNRRGYRPGYDLSKVYTRAPPKKVTVMRNGEPNDKHMVLLNRRTAQTFEQVLKTLSDLFQIAIRKLFTIEGILIDGLQKMVNGPEVLVAASNENFIDLRMDYITGSRARTRMSTNLGSHVNLRSRMQSRRDRLTRTKGRWRVTVRTNALPSAGTQSQVTVTVYGNKGNSGAITLGHGDGRNFQPGHVDEFDISVGNVGEIYKVRIAHDNSGDFPGWLCDEVHMKDLDTGEDLTFSCRRWLARDEDDQEITRELAVKRPGEPILPLIKYQVDVVTGDMWGGGTDANVYMTMYGDRGDTGVRQLYTETKGVYFKQGQLDTFEVEAVSLGHLKRIIIGHDGTGPGSGWFLDKVIIREPPFRPNQGNVFYCGKWLDEGEDDGKIVRELRVQDEYMDDILEKRNWEYEKWKYERDCQVMLYSVMTGKALRLNKDMTVDGVGEEKDRMAMFRVIPKKPMKPMFASASNAAHHLAIDSGRITGLGKGGPYCEFRVRAQADHTTLFESVKNPLQFLTIGADGAPGEVRGILDKEPSKRFYVYAKGCFRHKGVIMLGTSQLQCINLNKDDDTLTGRGKRFGPVSQFRVHKVSAGGIRMFESIAKPGNYIRLKDGKIDCRGTKNDPDTQFLVLRHKDKGYITIQSASQRGLFLGLTTEGVVHTTIDTGVRNIWLYPEVVEWGNKKKRNAGMEEEEPMEQIRRVRTPETVTEKSPTPQPTPTPVRQFAEGDWSVHVSTLAGLENADVALVVYGDKGNSGPIILGAPPGKQIFQDGNEDEFRANLLKVGKMFKIRLELLPKSSMQEPSWQVKDVRMQDLNTNETVKFTFNRWLSREEDDQDIMREMPVVRPGENVLPVCHYMVSVYTGKEKGAETDVPVYIQVHGEKGDWGKRYLMQSNNNKKYRVGQVDVFHIEAVSLGNLQRCVIGHDGTGAGEGWYLDQVVIKENEDSLDEYIFPCDRWLDTSLEDRKIERTLVVKEPSPSKVRRVESLGKIEEEELPPVSMITDERTASQADDDEDEKTKTPEKKVRDKGKFNIEIITGSESGSPNGGRVHITLYGDRAKSDQVVLYATNPTQKTFEPGNIDQFNLETEDLGDLYKIRLGREDGDKWDRWFLGEVRVSDEMTGEKMVFSFNRWLARDMEDGDLCRELPAILPGRQIPELLWYQVQVYTGDHWAASTDANMYITIQGTKGDSGKRLLHKCNNNRVKFQRGQMDMFEFEVVSMEELTGVVISHDGRGHGAGVFLDKVVVREKDTTRSHLQYVFPCGRWLDTHEEDHLTERTLRMIDIIDANKPPPQKEAKKSSGHWSVTVKTSAMDKAGTTAQVFLTVYGTSGHSDREKLTPQDRTTSPFTPGAEAQFQVKVGDVGKITKIRLDHDSSGSDPDWRVDYVKMVDNETHKEMVFYLDRWLATDQDDGQICREIPVIRKGTPGLPVLRYIVAVTTGSYKDAGTDNGTVSINLIGVNGDTGMRELNGAISRNRLPLQTGQTDIYVVEAVSVGKLKKVEITFKSAAQNRWYLERVNVSEGARAAQQFVCYCHQWMLSSDNQVCDFPVTEVQPSTSLVEAVESIPKGLEKPVRSKGRWIVYVQTGLQNDSGTKERVCMVMCGLLAESEPIRVNAKDELNPGSFIKFEAKILDIGLLFKVRLLFEDKHQGSAWFLAKMKLKDQDTGEELHFEYNDWIESTNENPEGALELPVVRPDLEPLKEQIYIVSVKTGDVSRAETEANVYCHLIGQWGSTGHRSLAVSNNNDLFRQGQLDQFTVTSIELGAIHNIVIGHDAVGRGQGWFCHAVNVKVAEEIETLFSCNRWLDSGCDDRCLQVELSPVSVLPASYFIPTKYTKVTEGKWNFHITTAGQDRLHMVKPGDKSMDVSIVVYGSESVQGPIELTSPEHEAPVSLLAPGKTDHYYNYDMPNVGVIEKIRVSSGYEGDTESVWTIQKVVLEEQTSQSMLTFDFGGWVGEMGGDIRKEMPLVLPDKSNRQVFKYYMEVHTSEAEMSASTNSNVFITLYGSNSDSGRRHLVRSKDTKKRFQPGQVDKFDLEAVDLGDLEKLVVAKGPGKPWLLEKIVVKKGEFLAEEHVFMFEGWIGDKAEPKQEVEETITLTATIPSQVAISLHEAPQLEPSNGVWVVESLTGGRRGPDGPLDAVVVFCGVEGESTPVLLQSTRDNPFQIGQTDTFQVEYSEKIGELRKVRLGFEDPTEMKAWYIRKITFEDQDSHDIFWMDMNEWVAVDDKLDGWKEVAVPWPAIQPLPVMRYVVTIHVGEVGADWADDTHPYIQIYGQYGGTGKRLLKHSVSNTAKIRENQTDIFEVEAVHLGDLMKVIVGHGNSGKGGGFYLERVIVQESPDAKEILFECNRWLDAGEGDGQTERTLLPIDSEEQPEEGTASAAGEMFVPLLSPKPSIPEYEPTPEVEETEQKEPEQQVEEPVQEVEEPVQEVETEEVKQEDVQEVVKSPTPEPEGTAWSVTTTTGGDIGEGTVSPVILILYGEKGHSQPLVIGEDPEFRFTRGQTDAFKIVVAEDIGDVYKVRVGFHGEENYLSWYENQNVAPSWFLEKLMMKNEVTGKTYEFEAGLWVRVSDHQDFWRELPVLRELEPLEVYQYYVTVYTGEESKAGTDANVYIQIFGECGDTGYRKLMTSKTHSNKFEQGQHDVFEIGAVDLGKLSMIKIRHDGSGPGSGWQLDRIVIKENESTTIRYVFRYGRWLDEGDGERGVEQTLMLSDILVSDEEENKEEDLPGNPWTVQTVTGDDATEGTSSAVELVLYDRQGHSEAVVVGEKQGFRFNMGSTDTFNVRMLQDLSDLYKVRVGFHGADTETGWYQDYNQAPTWFLEQLKLTNETTGKDYEIQGTMWLKIDTYQDYWREQPVLYKDMQLPELYQYQVEVYTGNESKAGTDANVSINIYGELGDTGLRRLMASKTHDNKFEQGNVDLFELNAVDLGKLSKVKVSHDGAGIGSGWFLEKIVVRETDESRTRHVFECGGWLDVPEGETTVIQEFPLTDILEGEEEAELPGNPWTVWCVTGSDVGGGTDNPAEIVLYGSQGHSEPVVFGADPDFRFNRGQVDVFEIKVVGEVGELFKVRVGFHGNKHDSAWYQNYSLAPSWNIESFKLKNETTGQEYELEAGVSVQTERHTDFWREMPVVNTDSRLNVHWYQVEVYTGEKWKGGTDANVSIQIYGEHGDTGLRRLMDSKTNSNKFESGERDVFEIPAVDLGQLTKVKVSHDGSGAGSGWLLDKVIVKLGEEDKMQYVFTCGQWLDDGDEDTDPEVTIPLSDIIEATPTPDVKQEDDKQYKAGDWKVYVTTGNSESSGTDSNVTLTVYGDADNTGPIALGSVSTGFFYSGKTDQFDVFLDPEDLGQLRKIRLEHDNSGKDWEVEKVVMENMTDHTKIEFPINKWLRLEKGFDIAVEVPIEGKNWPVRDYVVRTDTGDGFGSGTDAMVHINLIGTIGDSGKRYLAYNLEDSDDKFESGQTDTFIVQAVDLGRPTQIQIGHNGQGPGSGWFLKTVYVKEAMDAEETYVFKCEQWLHDEKGDGLIERLLTIDTVNKGTEFIIDSSRKSVDQDNERADTTQDDAQQDVSSPQQLDDGVEQMEEDDTALDTNRSQSDVVDQTEPGALDDPADDKVGETNDSPSVPNVSDDVPKEKTLSPEPQTEDKPPTPEDKPVTPVDKVKTPEVEEKPKTPESGRKSEANENQPNDEKEKSDLEKDSASKDAVNASSPNKEDTARSREDGGGEE